MKLTRREEIAIWILVACADAGDALIRTERAASAADSSKDQTAQVVLQLSRCGLIETARGKYGGIRLALPPEQVTLGMVLDGLGAGRLRGSADVPRRRNPLEAIAQLAAERVQQTFESFTIADLARGRVADKLTCLDCSIRLGVLRRRTTPALPAPPMPPAGPMLAHAGA